MHFWVYGIVYVPEFIAWSLYIADEDPTWFGWWVPSVGYWGTIIFAALPVIFAIFQLGFPSSMGGLDGDQSVEFGFNSVFLITIGFAVWFQGAILHWVLTERLECYVSLNPRKNRVNKVECPLKKQLGQSE